MMNDAQRQHALDVAEAIEQHADQYRSGPVAARIVWHPVVHRGVELCASRSRRTSRGRFNLDDLRRFRHHRGTAARKPWD